MSRRYGPMWGLRHTTMLSTRRGGSPGPAVVVSGLGLKTGLGDSSERTWHGLKHGRGAARRLDHGPFATIGPYHGVPMRPRPHRLADLAHGLAGEAMRDAGLDLDSAGLDRDRVATVFGVSKGDLKAMAAFFQNIHNQECSAGAIEGPPWSMAWPDVAAVAIANQFGFRGPCLAPIAACATGVVAVLRAAAMIRDGTCDVALAGAVDSSLEPLVLGAFRRMRVMARVEGDPTAAMRPWDRGRSGFLVGEGGAILVLEREDHAKARGACLYAVVAGGALGSDAYHETDLNPDPSRLAALIREALDRSEVEDGEMDYVNVHGTATQANDPLECRAIRSALKARADAVSCSASKAAIGHLLGGAGAAELAITCLAIRDQFAPPTLNLTDPDPECDLDGTPLVGRHRSIRAALKLSLGFGGHLAVAVLRRPDGPRRSPSINVNS